MNSHSDGSPRQNRVSQLIVVLAESARTPRFDGTIKNIFEVLKAARLDPHVVHETRRIIATLPDGVVEKFLNRYRNRDPSDRKVKSKYFNLPVHVAHAVWQAKQLGLYEARQPLRIVDLGTGFGYFPLVCNSLDHRTIGVDWDQWKVYESISKDIPIDRREWEVTPEWPMPELTHAVDMVTAFRPVFYYEFDTDSLWPEEKWNIFFDRLLAGMAKNGTIFIGENRITEAQKPHHRAMVEYFRRMGGVSRCNGWYFQADDLATRIPSPEKEVAAP